MNNILTIGPIRLDIQGCSVTMDSKTVRLTPVESRVLRFLMEHANTVCTPQQISLYAWGVSDDGTQAILKVHIIHLRHKVEPDPASPVYILTILGEGYMFVIPQAG